MFYSIFNLSCYIAEPGQIFFSLPATYQSWGIWELHNDIMVFLIIICFFVLWMLFAILLRFKSSKVWKDLYNNMYSFSMFHPKQAKLEFVWALLPTTIIIVIALPSFALLYSLSEIGAHFVNIKAIGNQWYWSYEIEYGGNRDSVHVKGHPIYKLDQYMDSADMSKIGFWVYTPRLLHTDLPLFMPVNLSIRMVITSTDVLHSWTIPAFGIKLDACPGRLNSQIIKIFRPGTYYGQCSEICGVNHGFMPILVRAMPMR